MAFLNQKERVFDIILTDKGRELLSKNQLVVSYYAFSDDGIDYSGSLSSSFRISGSNIDDYVHKMPLFEADQRKNATALNTYLYTVAAGTKALPDIKIGANISSSLVLERRFTVETIELESKPKIFIKNPKDVVVKARVKMPEQKDREEKYVLDQKISQTLKLLGNKNENSK